MQSEVRTFSGTGNGGGLSGSVAYTDAFDCSKAQTVLVEFRYVKSTVDLTIGLVDDASDSENTTIAALKFPLVSTLQTGGGSAGITHSITATTTGAFACNVGGLVKNARVSMQLSGAGAVADTLDLRVVIFEEVE